MSRCGYCRVILTKHTISITCILKSDNFNFYLIVYGNVCFWIGGVRTSDDKFEWLDGEQITEYQWDKEQPNNIDGQYCITLNPGTYKWNDRGCSSYCYSVCELL
jgi:hypothetical protein